eukprot:scaffold10263_cov143-Skeletonema_marinoi.AAC.2
MAGRVVSQLLKGTNWGELDVLVLDLPPGTGDVQLEVCQSLSLTGAVAVSTPSALAWADVRKGVEMFGELGGGGRHYPFGKARTLAAGDDGDDGSNETTSDAPMQHHHFMPQSSHVFHLPISETVSDSNESGKPFCCDEPNGNSEVFSKLADAVSADLLLLQHNMMPASMQGHQGSGYQKIIGGDDLRSRNPKTGEVEENSSSNSGEGDGKTVEHGCGGGSHSSDRGSSQPSITVHHDKKDNLFPAKLSKKGKYGYEVEWADGATIIYSLLAIAKAAGGKPLESTPE